MSGEIVVSPTVTPMDLISRAQASNASIEQMQQLFDLQLRYEANEARKAFNGAMSDFRELAPAIARKRTGHNIKYAGLSESIEAIQPLLSQFGLSHQWKTRQDGALITVECTVTHRMGHSESTSLSASPDSSGSKNAIQAIGSTVSYLERYTLYAILGLSSREMDDDGKAAASKKSDNSKYANDNNAKALRKCTTLDGLAAEWAAIPNDERPRYTEVKEEMKVKLSKSTEAQNA